MIQNKIEKVITKDEIEKAFEGKGPGIIETTRLQWDVEDGTMLNK